MLRILVANRGEIAVRVMRTVRRMGLTAIAVHSEADREAPHVAAADVAVALPGGSSPRESYLDMDKVLEAARRAGADAIHPGYGFLSENAEFARRCVEAGLVFIGPPADVIRVMGDKQRARSFLKQHGIATVPGLDEPLTDPASIVESLSKIGYPVLVKAAAGGGGKGMRVVRGPEEAPALVESCQREASAAFGDGRLLVERYVEVARHIEVQVFGDAHGNVVHLLDRECSAQRRHQKIVEEAPAPGLPDAVRQKVRETAVTIARAAGYRNAGTVEFIVDPEGNAWFLEMNTRLQVEHPVTEAVTGLDLVELQIRVARGEPLPPHGTSITPDGHAIEARVYAEDPSRGFLPTTGKVLACDTSRVDPAVRLDSGIRAGGRVGIDYDPLLLKVVAHGADRATALARLRRALGDLALLGLTTNQRMLVDLLGTPEMVEGRIHTTLVEKRVAAGLGTVSTSSRGAVAAMVLAEIESRRIPGLPIPDRFRNNAHGMDVISVTIAGEQLSVGFVEERRGQVRMILEGATHVVTDEGRCGAWRRVGVDGVSEWHLTVIEGDRVHDHGPSGPLVLERAPRLAPVVAPAASGDHRAPMTGRVVRILVEEGQEVAIGAPLVVLEAMKMEHTLNAAVAGKVTRVAATVGKVVEQGTELIGIEEAT